VSVPDLDNIAQALRSRNPLLAPSFQFWGWQIRRLHERSICIGVGTCGMCKCLVSVRLPLPACRQGRTSR